MTDEAPKSDAPRFLGDRPRFKTIPLEWPIEFEGAEYREVVIVRLTTAEVAAFEQKLEALRATEPEARVRWPLFHTAEGAPLPDGLLDALDDDDKFAIDQAAASFLPRRYGGVPATDTPPANGGSTAPSSAG